MKYSKVLSAVGMLIMSFSLANAQDIRTTDTKVADLLAQLPSKDNNLTDRLMSDILAMGETGMNMICVQVVPTGTGDDTKPRFAAESISRYLSKTGREKDRVRWEQICIAYVVKQNEYTIKDFFMKQLQLVGTDASVDAVKVFLTDKNLCHPAVAVMSSVKGRLAEKLLSEALKDKSLPCAASAMNALAAMRSGLAVNEFIAWSFSPEKDIQAAACNAMAQSGNPLALPVLTKAAKSSSYKWDHTGATEALLTYARISGEKGDAASMDKICKTVITNCNSRDNIQYKTEALSIMVRYHGYDAMPLILEALGHQEKSYRNAALQLSLELPEQAVTRKLMEYYAKASPAVKPEIICNLGARKDELAVLVVSAALSDADPLVRAEAASSIVKIKGAEATPDLLGYLIRSSSADDQEAARNNLMTILDSSRVGLLVPALDSAGNPGKKSAIELLAWSREPRYFMTVLEYTSHEDEQVRSAAFRALSSLSSPADQYTLMEMISVNDNPVYIADMQLALVAAANQIDDPEKRSADILGELALLNQKEKLIPVLAMTGGRQALVTVLNEFEAGSPEMRKICFDALTSWKDYTASSALYEICKSGNKSYEGPAFDGYVRQVSSAPVTDDQRLQLYRKIMPFALDNERKKRIINELGKIRTYQSLFFTASYLDDPATNSEAAIAVMYIALPSVGSRAGLYGTLVKDILSKALLNFRGAESDYNKELVSKYLEGKPGDEGFIPMFNGKDLTGWQGLVGDPVSRAKMKPADLSKKQAEANRKMT